MGILRRVANAIDRFFQGIGPFEDIFHAECSTSNSGEKLSVGVRTFLPGSEYQGKTLFVVRVESIEGAEIGIQSVDIHLSMPQEILFRELLEEFLAEISPSEEGGMEEQLIPRVLRNDLVARKVSKSEIVIHRSVKFEFGPRSCDIALVRNTKYHEMIVVLNAYVAIAFFLHSTLRRSDVQKLILSLKQAEKIYAETAVGNGQ